jgi:hypothetical protein
MAWINRRTPLADDQTRDLSLAYRISFQAMRTGHGSEQAWSTLACALNVSLLLAERGNLAGNIDCIKAAQEALMSSLERASRLGRWGFNGDEMKTVMRAVAIHDEQIETTTRAEISAALQEVHRRVMAGEVLNGGGERS